MSYLGNNVQPVNNQGAQGGDFDSVSLLDNVVRGDLALHVRSTNNPTQDINGSLVISDCPLPVVLTASTVGQAFTIDTIGYRSIAITTRAFAGSILGSNDGVTYSAIQGINVATLSNSTSVAASTSYIVPCVTRYVRFTTTTLGMFTYFLRNIDYVASNNLSYIGGGAVNQATSQLGINVVNIGGTANASQAGTLTLGTTAATNGMTLGTLVAPLTVATTTVKATAGKLYHMTVSNAQASAVYLKLYNAAAVTLGTTAATLNYMIPASSSFSLAINDVGLYFSTGIIFAVTGGQALTDSTALTTAATVNYSFI